MYIKLKIEGDLLKALESDAEEYVRTCTQQAMYIIKPHYKNKFNENSMTKFSSQNINVVTDIEKEEFSISKMVKNDLEVLGSEIEESEVIDSDVGFLDDEIYNF